MPLGDFSELSNLSWAKTAAGIDTAIAWLFPWAPAIGARAIGKDVPTGQA